MFASPSECAKTVQTVDKFVSPRTAVDKRLAYAGISKIPTEICIAVASADDTVVVTTFAHNHVAQNIDAVGTVAVTFQAVCYAIVARLGGLVLTGFAGAALAVLFQVLLAPDVALTQAIVGAAIVPVFIALAVKKTQRSDG